MDEMEIKKIGEKISREFIKIVCSTEKDQDNNIIEWKFIKKSGAISIYSRPSTSISGALYKTEVNLDYPPSHVLTLLSTIHKYRHIWDPMVEDIQIIKPMPRKGNHNYLVRHLVAPKFNVISRRESIDVVSYGQTNEFYFISGGSVDHPDYPIQKGLVRATVYPSGYTVGKIQGEPNKCVWGMVLHADINMNSIGSFLVDMVKPHLITHKATSLVAQIDKLTVDSDDLIEIDGLPRYEDTDINECV